MFRLSPRRGCLRRHAARHVDDDKSQRFSGSREITLFSVNVQINEPQY